MKNEIVQKCVEFCAIDLRPFESVAGTGFLRLAQALIDLGAAHGNISAKEIIPHPTTISRGLADAASDLRNLLFPEIDRAMSNGFCAATTDMWTDDFKKISYTSVTIHYIDDDWNLL